MARQAGFDRNKVLARAQALFWKKGYHATSMKDLEAALDLRPGSIYGSFGSKEALFAETLRTYGQQTRARFREMLASAPSPLAGLAGYVRAVGGIDPDTVPANACMLVKTLLETPDTDADLRQMTEEMMRHMEAEMVDAFAAARAAGELPDSADPNRLASRLLASIFGLRTYAQRSDSRDRVEQLAEDMAREIEALAGP